MIKKILAIALCALMLALPLASCTPNIKGENATVGPHIYMYLADEVYDFDPMNAYTNDSALKLASLMFEPLFKLDDNGKVTTDGLVKKYEIDENTKSNEYKMTLTLKDAYWNDGTAITAGDIVYAWKRIMEVDASSPAATLLYDVKNARAVKEGDKSIDYLGIYDAEEFKLEIEFEGKIDYNKFLVNLTSYMLCPIREDIVTKSVDDKGSTEDWAKKFLTIACSGPFTPREVHYTFAKGKNEVAGIILERNPFYYRDQFSDQFDKTVKISRIYVDWSLSEEEIIDQYNAGQLCYVGEIPVSYRGDVEAEVSDALSTHTYILNTNKEPFNKKEVRNALSLAINRQAIADAVVYAKVADAIVPYGVFDSTPTSSLFGTKYEEFRKNGDSYIASEANVTEAKKLLSAAGINPADYSFSVSYFSNDKVHKLIASEIVKAWNGLGFKVSLNPINPTINDDERVATNEIAKDICDDNFKDALKAGDFDVIAVDLLAYSADSFQYLAQFATGFSGEKMNMDNVDENGNPVYVLPNHISGFNNAEYTMLINAAYYLPYYETITEDTTYEDFSIYDSQADFEADIAAVKAVYEKYGINTSFKDYSKAQSILLHEAEKLLMEEMPVIPVIYNQNAYLKSKDLKKVTFDYYGNTNFIKTTHSGSKSYMQTYELGIYAPVEE